jgi:predicted component of type VI protein secretion system
MHVFYLVPLSANAQGGDSPDAVVAVDQLPCVVGRHPACDRRIHSPQVSRRHCAFWQRDGRAWVADLGSSNGTRLNGKRLAEASPLAEGDRLDIAGLPFLCLSRTSYEESAGEAGEAFSLAVGS